MNHDVSILHLFSGLGGAALGFQQAVEEHKGVTGRFTTLAGIDVDPAACEDFEALTGAPCHRMDLFTREDYRAFHGREPGLEWHEVEPADLVAVTHGVTPDVIFTSPPCLPGSAEVLTLAGPRRIETVRSGDNVLTHKGRYREVLKVGTHLYDGPMYRLRLNGSVEFQEFTAEHPLWRRRVVRAGANRERRLGPAEFVRAEDIRVGDRIGFPIDPEIHGTARRFVQDLGDPQVIERGGHNPGVRYAKPAHEATDTRIVDLRPLAESRALWFLVGAYLGDGYRRGDRYEVSFCVGPTAGGLAGDVRKALGDLGLSWTEDANGGPGNIKIRAQARHLWMILGQFGDGAAEKRIPAALIHLDEPLLRELVAGYRATDGSAEPRRTVGRETLQARWKIPSISLGLLKDMQRLLLRTGVFAGIHQVWRGGPQVIEGRTVQTRPRWELNVRLDPVKRTVYEFDDGAVWVRVRAIETRPAREMVWNLEVAEDNTFCTHLMATHNCKGFSGLLPKASSESDKYQALNRLVTRGLFLAMEAFKEDLPALILMENVPRITSRGKYLLKDVKALLFSYGYVFSEGYHDCGELGGLAQHRRRYLMIARNPQKIATFIYQPPKERVRAIGEVLEKLPLPDDPIGGPLHRLPRLQWKTWVRLALIPAGGDWRDLQDPCYGNCRITPESNGQHTNKYRVQRWDGPAATVTGSDRVGSGAPSVADPRFPSGAGRHTSHYRVGAWDAPGGTVTGADHMANGAPAVADPRVPFNNVFRVTGWDETPGAVTGGSGPSSSAVCVADPRLGCSPRSGAMRVLDWGEPASAVTGAGDVHSQGAAVVADPRIPAEAERGVWVIVAEDGTWHRPLTTLELAALQGFPLTMPDGRPLTLAGKSDSGFRERIGNAVPVPTARAIGETILRGVLAAREGVWLAGGTEIWVQPGVRAC
ncbi:MAG: DNA cytosine methyltransferase [Symbiobacteriia bacterium]